jgi:hypothetical protein
MKDKALVSGFVRSFISGKPIPDATITALENEALSYKTDSAGKFGPFEWPIGQPITLVFNKPGSFWTGYRTTQTATLIVPPEGINNPNYLKNISFQVPSNMAFKFFAIAMGKIEDPEACQIAATITPPNMTMDDIPQGMEGVTATLSPQSMTMGDISKDMEGVRATLSPQTQLNSFYFGMFPIIHKTNPFISVLNATSLDGGVAFLNVPPGDYIMEAKKEGVTFSKVSLKARKGVVVNASPPHGPVMQHKTPVQKEKTTHSSSSFIFFKSEITMGATAFDTESSLLMRERQHGLL